MLKLEFSGRITLAASRFEAEAVPERDALAARMSAEQVAKAQDLAAAWQSLDDSTTSIMTMLRFSTLRLVARSLL